MSPETRASSPEIYSSVLPELESIMSFIIIKWGLNEEVTVVDKAEKQWIQLFASIKPGLLRRVRGLMKTYSLSIFSANS